MDTPLINDLSISVATENGSGSASSNNILFKAIFKMGIPCSSKNMFPSNIQGLPTWYQIRASAEGYLSRKDVIDVMVMFNDATASKDIYRVRDGGLILYDDSTPLPANLKRDGVQYIGFPANKLVAKLVPASPLRAKQRNMVYVGALAYLFGIDMDVIKAVLEDTFGRKPAVIESNLVCIDAGYQYLKEKGATQNIARLQPIPDGNKGKIITEGNTAAAIGAIYGGASVICWYPITPSSSLAEAMEYYLPRLRKSSDGKKNLCHRSGRGRNRFGKHGRRRGVGRRAVDDFDLRAGGVVDERIHRPGLLRRDTLCIFYHPARRSVDRFTDANPAG